MDRRVRNVMTAEVVRLFPDGEPPKAPVVVSEKLVVRPRGPRPTLIEQAYVYNKEQLDRLKGWKDFDEETVPGIPFFCLVHRDRNTGPMPMWLESVQFIWVIEGDAKIAPVKGHISFAGVTHVDLDTFQAFTDIDRPLSESGLYVLTANGDCEMILEVGEDDEVIDARVSNTAG